MTVTGRSLFPGGMLRLSAECHERRATSRFRNVYRGMPESNSSSSRRLETRTSRERISLAPGNPFV